MQKRRKIVSIKQKKERTFIEEEDWQIQRRVSSVGRQERRCSAQSRGVWDFHVHPSGRASDSKNSAASREEVNAFNDRPPAQSNVLQRPFPPAELQNTGFATESGHVEDNKKEVREPRDKCDHSPGSQRSTWVAGRYTDPALTGTKNSRAH